MAKQTKKKENYVLNVIITRDLNADLEEIIEEYGNSKSWHIRKALKPYIDKIKEKGL